MNFRTISEPVSHRPMSDEDFLEALGEVGETLDYAVRASKSGVPVSVDYLRRAQELHADVRKRAETMVFRSMVKNAAWFALGAIASAAAQIVVLMYEVAL